MVPIMSNAEAGHSRVNDSLVVRAVRHKVNNAVLSTPPEYCLLVEMVPEISTTLKLRVVVSKTPTQSALYGTR